MFTLKSKNDSYIFCMLSIQIIFSFLLIFSLYFNPEFIIKGQFFEVLVYLSYFSLISFCIFIIQHFIFFIFYMISSEKKVFISSTLVFLFITCWLYLESIVFRLLGQRLDKNFIINSYTSWSQGGLQSTFAISWSGFCLYIFIILISWLALS